MSTLSDRIRQAIGQDVVASPAIGAFGDTGTGGDEAFAETGTDELGYGPIEPYLTDPAITEIMANTPDAIYVVRDGRLGLTDARFRSEAHMRRVIERIVGQIGRCVDESSPMVDARLPDGSRVNAVLPPLSVDGPMLTIRKSAAERLTVADMLASAAMSPAAAAFLKACVVGRCNILVSGGAGSGKTTLLAVLSGFIPADERLVTIEDAVELRLQHEHVVRLESRPPDIEGRGEVTVRDLVRNSLRMRPDRIIVGGLRGGEALDVVQAMNTGHEGSLTTLHADSPADALARLETMVRMAGVELPAKAIREQVASALDLVVHVARLRDGSRRIVSIAEVAGHDDVLGPNDLYRFDHAAGTDATGSFIGQLEPVGVRPRFAERLEDLGIALPPALFGEPGQGPSVEAVVAAWLADEAPGVTPSEATGRRRTGRRPTSTGAG